MTEVHDMNSKIPLCAASYEPLGNELFQLVLTKVNKAEIFEHGLTKLKTVNLKLQMYLRI
jgi:hypothetical protein